MSSFATLLGLWLLCGLAECISFTKTADYHAMTGRRRGGAYGEVTGVDVAGCAQACAAESRCLYGVFTTGAQHCYLQSEESQMGNWLDESDKVTVYPTDAAYIKYGGRAPPLDLTKLKMLFAAA
eukprot:TRINITY_DN82588_c0_g1_i1.p2 TRINITY_DN82588_c0_g1~~TRINITY_DN82588_c0_g1_i1.p2  ORF type:complete len:142 (-),score=15.17 TRINITY_DN82588_c0_g1_i1:98-469(-)